MCRCPSCETKIRFRTIFFALRPVWLRCPACGARLVGNRFVKAQGVVVLGIAVAAGIPAGLWVVGDLSSLPGRSLAALGVIVAVATAVAVPMTVLTMRRGGYEEREQDLRAKSP